MRLLAIALATALAAEPDATSPESAPLVISSNSVLAAGVDRTGALRVLRWPGAGGPDQMNSAPGLEGGWRIFIGDRWRTLGDADVRLSPSSYGNGTTPKIGTSAEWQEPGILTHQECGVLPDFNLFIDTIAVTTTDESVRLGWISSFAPARRHVAEIAMGEDVLDSKRGFASFVEPSTGRIWHFRPKNPGAAERRRAQELVASAAPPGAWAEAFGDGVWVGLTGGISKASWRTGSRVDGTLREHSLEGDNTGRSARVGLLDARANSLESDPRTVAGALRNVASFVEFPAPEDAPEEQITLFGFVVVGVGKTYADVSASLDGAAKALSEFETISNRIPDVPSAIQSRFGPGGGFAGAHWVRLQWLHDAESGYTVRGISSVPPLARDWPREGAIAAWAFGEAGDLDTATKAIEAYLSQIRLDDRARRPYGSMPESLYTSGEPASPHFLVDDRGPARVLWVADRLLRDRTGEERAAWVRRHWRQIAAAAEFLSGWADARRGAPLWCDDPVDLSDAETQDRLFAAHAGMAAALRLAADADTIVPDIWRARDTQLRELAEWVLTTPGKWHADSALVLEIAPLRENALRATQEATVQRLQNPAGLTNRQLASLLLQSALLHGYLPDSAGPSAEAIDRVLDRIWTMRTPDGNWSMPADSFVSAQVLIALLGPAKTS